MITAAQTQKLIKGMKTSKNDFGKISDEVLEHLDIIAGELMKRGTLTADTFDLIRVEDSCNAVLKECTHLMAIRGSVIVLTMSNQSEALVSAFQLTTALFKTHWPDLHPQGTKQARRRKAWATDIIAALDAGVTQVIHQNGSLPPPCQKEGLRCVEACKKAEQDTALLAKSLRDGVAANKTKILNQSTLPASSQSDQLDAKGRADLRRDIRSITDRIERNDPTAGIAYTLRSYAAWLDFQSIPDANKAGVTKQQEMPEFVVEEHRKNLKTPSASTLAKLEDRLYMTPDWLEGHKIAHDMARAMGRSTIAKAIVQRVKDRLATHPELEHLKYQTKRPILSEEIQSWILGAAVVPIVATKPAEQDNQPQQSVDELLPQLQALNAELSKAISPRSCALIKFQMARVVGESGLKEQSKMMVGELVDQMADEVLQKWDAELYAEFLKENG